MSKAFSPTEWAELRSQFEERREKQLLLVEAHESAYSYGMAYLALWAALEFFAKRLGPVAHRQELKDALSDWLEYLGSTAAKMPAKIGPAKFDIPKLETVKIPSDTSLQRLFPLHEGASFYLVTDPNRKYRTRRNDIAHKGEATSLKVYEEFKGVALKALSEIELWLSGGGV